MVSDFRAPSGTPAYTHVEMTQVVLPQFANSLGTVFGGQILAWIDICAAVSAQRHAKAQVVTASFDGVNFIAPIRQGHVVILRSQVTATFHTSMEVGVTVTMEDPVSGERKHAAHAYCTFVALDKAGKPRSIPALVLTSEEDKKRYDSAVKRREMRLKAKQLEVDRSYELD